MSSINRPDAKLTFADYMLFPIDGNRHEIVDGDELQLVTPRQVSVSLPAIW